MSSSCTGMAFFPANFMLQTPDNGTHPPSLSSILPSCTPQDFHGNIFILDFNAKFLK